jgi:2-haloacid dehalogenase
MSLDPESIETITFDSFSTVVDIDSTAPAVEGYVDDPIAFAREWHTRAANYGTIANHIDAYGTYYDLHKDALSYLLAREGYDPSEEEIEEMTSIYHEMEPFEDVREGMERLAGMGYDLGIVSNGDPPMLESMVRAAGIGDLIDETVSADEIERHKPARELYEHAADRLDTDPAAVVHVSNAYTDVQGAMHAGMGGVWLDREDVPEEPFGPDADLVVESIPELLDRL